jgi:peptide/nickel transport system ATP-binding protein
VSARSPLSNGQPGNSFSPGADRFDPAGSAGPPDTVPAGTGGTGGTGGASLAEFVGVTKHFSGSRLWGNGSPPVQAVAGVDLAIPAGKTIGVVGESGCGKSTLGRLLVGLEHPTSGQICLKGRDLASFSHAERKAARFDVQMMFQDPYASLNPRMSVLRTIEEPLRAQGALTRGQRRAAVTRLVSEVGLSTNQLDRFPHELSGGQRQRVGLARALATNAALIVADEPVSALDVSVRSQILKLMTALQDEHGLAYLMISHDLAVVRWIADHIFVMYLGKIVESGNRADLFERPSHHYTKALIDAVPEPDPGRPPTGPRITGELPSAAHPPSGCRFRTRCPAAQPRCSEEEPTLRSFGGVHRAACHFPLMAPPSTPLSAVAAPSTPLRPAEPGPSRKEPSS